MAKVPRYALLIPLIAAPIFWMYSTHLQSAPIYLVHDEVMFALNAQSIASSGHDLNGRLLPLYFHIVGNFWATPIIIYSTAILFKLLPVNELVIRVPTLVVGLTDVVLMFFVGRRLFKSDFLACVAAAFLALSPAHFINSRLLLDNLYPVPFVLGWLLCVMIYREQPRGWLLFLATSLLGIGVYSYHASVVTMPLCFLFTCILLWPEHRGEMRTFGIAFAGFVWPLLLLIPWLARHPEHYTQHIEFFSLYDATKLNPIQGAKELLNYTSVTERVSVYYTYFNPSMLFFSGDTSVIHSTRRAGTFLLPLAIFLPVGLYAVATVRKTRINLVLVLGFLTSPIAAALVADYYRMGRALVMLPFAALIATIGVNHLLSSRTRAWRIVAICLLAVVPLQFYVFYRDYMTDYRVRTSGWFEGNIRGAVRTMMAREDRAAPGTVYLDERIPFVRYYWTLYARMDGRNELIDRAVLVNPKTIDARALPPGSLLLAQYQQDSPPADFRLVALIVEPSGIPMFAILEPAGG